MFATMKKRKAPTTARAGTAIVALGLLYAHSLVTPASAVADTPPVAWQACTATEDCTAVRDDKTCAVIAVNKTFEKEAAAYTAQQPGGKSTGMDGKLRCLHQPDAACMNNTCTLIVHPE